MLWFRRNLFWAVFGLAAFLLLGCGGYYLWSGLSQNSSVDEEINSSKSTLDTLLSQVPSPSQTNIDIARANLRQLENVLDREQKYFPDIPYPQVQGVEFVTILNSNITRLRELAQKQNIKLPSEHFAFSFEEQMNKARFANGSFPVMAEQLAEIKLIVAQLFDANINSLISVKRSKTPDDSNVSPYCHDLPRIDEKDVGLIICPYEVTFYAFSADFAKVLENFCNATNFLGPKLVVIKHDVDPSRLDSVNNPDENAKRGRAGNTTTQRTGVRGNPQTVAPASGGRARRAQPGRLAPPPPPPPPGETGELTTELDESLFRATLLIDVIKPAPTPTPVATPPGNPTRTTSR